MFRYAYRLWLRAWRLFISDRGLSFAGVASAVIIVFAANILVSRFYRRFDVTSAGLYTLTPATIETLDALDEPVQVVVFLSSADPLTTSVRYMLDAYYARTRHLHVRYVDPDRNPAEFVALQGEFGIFDGKTDNGRLATDASIVVVKGDQRWFITTDDIVVFDDDDGQARPQLEQVLTEGIVNVEQTEKPDICFTQGRGELSIDSGGDQGLSEFRSRLKRNNYHVRRVELNSPDPRQSLDGCALAVVAGLQTPFEATGAARLRSFWLAGGSVLLAVGALVDDEGRIRSTGLEPLLRPSGLSFGNNLSFEGDPALRLPVGLAGEVFLATPLNHPITAGMLNGDKAKMHVLLQLAQTVEVEDSSPAREVLHSSEDGFSVDSYQLLRGAGAPEALLKASQETRTLSLAAALEVPIAVQGDGLPATSRLLVLGSPSVLWGSTWREPSLVGTRRFVESALSWLVRRPKLVSVPQKPRQAAGLSLTAEAFSEVRRYVLFYMPGCAALIGLLIMLRRRHEQAVESRT